MHIKILIKNTNRESKREWASLGEYWGEMKDSVWNNYTQFLKEYNLIEKDLKASDAYTNEFLPQ